MARMRTAYWGGMLAVLTLAGVLALSRWVGAEDFEDPIVPTSTVSGYTEFGAVLVETWDVMGSSIDAREAIEPQLTVELIRDELPDPRSGVVQVITQPVFNVLNPSPE